MEKEVEQFLATLGIPDREKFLIDAEPPVEVDQDQLQAFRNHELGKQAEWDVAYLITHYRKWHEALQELDEHQSTSA